MANDQKKGMIEKEGDILGEKWGSVGYSPGSLPMRSLAPLEHGREDTTLGCIFVL